MATGTTAAPATADVAAASSSLDAKAHAAIVSQAAAVIRQIAIARVLTLQAGLASIDNSGDGPSCSTAIDSISTDSSPGTVDQAIHRLTQAAAINRVHALGQSPSTPTPAPFAPGSPGGPAPVLASSGGSDGGSGRNAGQDVLTVLNDATATTGELLCGTTWSLVCGPVPGTAIHSIAERPD